MEAGSSVDMSRSLEEDPLVEGPLIPADALHSVIRRQIQTIPTPYHASLLSFLHVVYVVLSACVAVLCLLNFGQEDVCASVLGHVQGDSVILFGKACLWVLVLLFTRCVRYYHDRARSKGYMPFFRPAQELHNLPLTVHSAGNVMLLVVLAARLSQSVQTYLLLIIIGLELLVAVPCLLYYTVKVIQFNRGVIQEEHSYGITSPLTETGFREGSSLEEVVEKQADLIEYLKQHNTLLSKRLLNLTAQH